MVYHHQIPPTSLNIATSFSWRQVLIINQSIKIPSGPLLLDSLRVNLGTFAAAYSLTKLLITISVTAPQRIVDPITLNAYICYSVSAISEYAVWCHICLHGHHSTRAEPVQASYRILPLPTQLFWSTIAWLVPYHGDGTLPHTVRVMTSSIWAGGQYNFIKDYSTPESGRICTRP